MGGNGEDIGQKLRKRREHTRELRVDIKDETHKASEAALQKLSKVKQAGDLGLSFPDYRQVLGA